MLHRFASGATVACMLVTCAAAVITLLPPGIREQAYPVLLAWVCLPALWGVWAMLAPDAWMPDKLPAWGSVLGVFAGVGALFIVDAPRRLAGFEATLVQRIGGIVVFVGFYYLLWTVVRRVFRALSSPRERQSTQASGL